MNTEERHVCNEIQYRKEGVGYVHSDICTDTVLYGQSDKDFLMGCFQEFLDNWDGKDGHFVINLQEVEEMLKDDDE